MPRLRGRQKHRVDYRHIIDWLVRKPGAFEHYRYRGELFPTSRFRMTFDLLEEQLGRHRGSKEYLKVLELAAKESEAGVDAVLRVLLAAGDEQISAKGIAVLLGADHGATVPRSKSETEKRKLHMWIVPCATAVLAIHNP